MAQGHQGRQTDSTIREGSIRVPAMLKRPGKIKLGVANDMFAVHNFFPTLAGCGNLELEDNRTAFFRHGSN